MTHRPRVLRISRLAAASTLALAMAGSALSPGNPAQASYDPNTDSTSTQTATDSVIVRFAGGPLATSSKVDRRSNGKVNLNGSKTRSVSADLAARRNAFKSWLRKNAPEARVTGEYDFALNGVAVRLNGVARSTIAAGPDVAQVTYQQSYSPRAHEDPDLAIIDGAAGWAAAGSTSSETDPTTWAGHGVQVGVVDTGIDASHPCFDDTGFPTTKQIGNPAYTNNKVIVARVFNNKVNQSGYDAAAVQDHGTHVAGSVACDLHTPADVDGADIPYDPSGVAPGAQLGNYNVFPGDVESARTEDIFNALEAAARDGMDVINMSLGGDAHGSQDLGTVVVDNLDRAGIVVTVSAGNEGPGDATIGSPGSAERALTAGAATVGHYVGVPITSGGSQITVGAIGDFPSVPEGNLSAPLKVVMDGTALSQACSPLSAGSLNGKIALVSRGTCTFDTKVSNAKDAGAIAVIVVNNIPGDPSAMGSSLAPADSLPAVMAPLSAKSALMAKADQLVTIVADPAYTRSGSDAILANFSSRGPVDVSYRIKPDVVAPGANVLSSIPMSFCDNTAEGCWAFLSGTSMSSPHLAGMSAVVLDAHPAWQAWQVRSAIVNTADQNGVKQTLSPTEVETNVQYVGSGMADLDAAVGAKVALSRPSVSFGAVPSGSAQARQQSVTVTNLTSAPLTLPVSVQDSTGDGTFSVQPRSITLPAGGSETLTVGFTGPKGAIKGHTQAYLMLGDAAHAALYAFLK